MNLSWKSSKYIGVRKECSKYKAFIQVNNKWINLGLFEKEYDAGMMYDKYVKTNNLNRRLNFPDPEPENLIPNTRLIRLTQGKFAIIDEEDFERVNQYTWNAFKHRNTWYARRLVRVNGICINIRLHQFILNKFDGLIDHINRDGLHNYKSNLRSASNMQNQQNRRVQECKSSKYKGVVSVGSKFKSSITVNKKRINLGRFLDEIEAAKAYDDAAKKYFGEFANTNFKN